MKFIAIIFASAIMFLAIKPGLDFMLLHAGEEINCCGTKCEIEEPHSDIDSHNDCSGNSCNPFQSCCTNVLFFKQTNVFIQFSEINISKEIIFFYNSIFKSEFENDFWQPPKIA